MCHPSCTERDEGFNSGVFVLRPSAQRYKLLVNYVRWKADELELSAARNDSTRVADFNRRVLKYPEQGIIQNFNKEVLNASIAS